MDTPAIRRERTSLVSVTVHGVTLTRLVDAQGKVRAEIDTGGRPLNLSDAEWQSFNQCLLYLAGLDRIEAERGT